MARCWSRGAITAAAPLSSAELYDVGLGFSKSWQPQIATVTSPLSLGGSLVVTGSQFRGISEGSGGNSQDSPADYPLVQLRSLESEQTVFLLTTNWSTNSFTSAAGLEFPARLGAGHGVRQRHPKHVRRRQHQRAGSDCPCPDRRDS